VVEEIDDLVAERHLSNSAVPESPSSPTENLSPFNRAGISKFDPSLLQGTRRRSSVVEKKVKIELGHLVEAA
jgi:hypothetical protein